MIVDILIAAGWILTGVIIGYFYRRKKVMLAAFVGAAKVRAYKDSARHKQFCIDRCITPGTHVLMYPIHHQIEFFNYAGCTLVEQAAAAASMLVEAKLDGSINDIHDHYKKISEELNSE